MSQLQCFVAVAEELHFGAAAARLRMTQPPLSRQIQLLERELGALLLHRTSRSVKLTPAGLALLPRARGILDLAVRTTNDVRRAAAGGSGTLTIGYTAMAAQSALPGLMRRLAAESPDVTVILRELVSTDQMEALQTGAIDIGLSRPVAARDGVATKPIHSEPLRVAVPDHHPLAAASDPVEPAQLSDEPFLMYSPGVARYFHDLVLGVFGAAGVQPRIAHYAGQVQTLLSFVHAGLGVALVPASAGLVVPDGVRLLALAADDRSRVQLDAAWSSDGVDPIVLRALELLGIDALLISIDAESIVDAHRSTS